MSIQIKQEGMSINVRTYSGICFLKQNCDFEHKLILIIVKYEIIILLILTNWYLQLKADTTYSKVSHGSASTGSDSYESYDIVSINSYHL